MGRQAHVLRPAYSITSGFHITNHNLYILTPAKGRSAFEPPERITESGEWSNSPVQRGISSTYVQQYDAKGHPINQRSRDHGRVLRTAQNDCLAAVGVIVKKEQIAGLHRLSQSSEVQLQNEQTLERLGSFAVSALTAVPLRCVYNIRDRILAFSPAPRIGLLEILLDQYNVHGPLQFLLAGFPAWLLAQASFELLDFLLLPEHIARLGLALCKSRPMRRLFQSTSAVLEYLERKAVLRWLKDGVAKMTTSPLAPDNPSNIRGCVADTLRVTPLPIPSVCGSLLVCYRLPKALDLLVATPLIAHATLQPLEVTGVHAVLPPLTSFDPRTPSSPFLISAVGLTSVSLIPTVFRSPALLLFGFESARRWVVDQLLASLPSSFSLTRAKSAISLLYEPFARLPRMLRSPTHSPETTPHHQGHAVRQQSPAQAASSNEMIESSYARRHALQAPSNVRPTVRVTSVDRAQGSMVIEVDVAQQSNEISVPEYEAPDYLAEASEAMRDIPRRRETQQHHHAAEDREERPLTALGVASLTESLRIHLAKMVGNAVLLPLRFVLLQRIVQTWRPSECSWVLATRSSRLLPGSRTELWALYGRLMFCCGLECAVRTGLWVGQVVVLLQLRKASRHQRLRDDIDRVLVAQ